MVSGAIAGFLDVAFNFNTQALLDDNLLGKLSDHPRNIDKVFFITGRIKINLYFRPIF